MNKLKKCFSIVFELFLQMFIAMLFILLGICLNDLNYWEIILSMFIGLNAMNILVKIKHNK